MRPLLFSLALLTASTLPAQDLGIGLGEKAPPAVVEALDGARVDIAKYIGKTPLLLEFWATWCSNCKDLDPAMRAAALKYGDKVKFIAVAVAINQSPERVKLYHAKHKLPMDVLYDRAGEAASAYDAPATSYVVVVNKEGKIVYTGLGGKQDLEAAIKKAL